MFNSFFLHTVGDIKNRATIRKMFETLPIFNDGLSCQLFMLMALFVSKEHLTCMLGIFLSSQLKWAIIVGCDVTPFSSNRIF
jgi:hypothetical protein